MSHVGVKTRAGGGARETVCSLRCVVSKGLSLRNWRRSWGTQHAVKGRKHVSCGRQTSAKALWQEPPLSLRGQSRTRGGRWGQVSGRGGRVVSVRGGLRGALQARGKSLGFVLCYGMRSVGSVGSVFHCQRSTLVSVSAISRDVLVEARDPFRGSCRCPGDAM